MIFKYFPYIRPHSERKDFLVRNVIINSADIEVLLSAFIARGLQATLYVFQEKYGDLPEILQQHGRNPKELEIRGKDERFGSISVLFRDGHARIRSKGSFVTWELQHELAGFLCARRSLKNRISSWTGWRFLSFSAFTAEFTLLFLEPVLPETYQKLYIFLWFAVFLWPASHIITRFLPPISLQNVNSRRKRPDKSERHPSWFNQQGRIWLEKKRNCHHL